MELGGVGGLMQTGQVIDGPEIRRTQMAQELDHLEKSVSLIGSAAGEVASRLGAVLRDEPPADTKAAVDPQQLLPSLAHLPNRIRDIRTSLDHINGILSSIIDRLEI